MFCVICQKKWYVSLNHRYNLVRSGFEGAQTTDDKCEIYALDGTLLDTVFNTTSFEFYHKKPDTASENYYSDIPEAVTIKYIYVDYVGPNLYAVSNERPAYIGY